jgi:RNA polymerase sigma-70 factor (ECF subfamily)
MPPTIEPPPAPPGSGDPPDHLLLRFARDGDQDAAAALYRRYADRLRRLVAPRIPGAVAARLDPDDVIQSVFRVFYEGVRERQYHVPADGELWGLLAALAATKLRDRVAYHRAGRRDAARTAAEADPDRTPAPAAEFDGTLRLVVDEYLDALPEPARTVVGLRMTGHTPAEIAGLTGRSVRTVERVLREARDRLADALAP